MNDSNFPNDVYTNYITALSAQLKRLKEKKSLVSWARLASIVLLVADVYYLYANHNGLMIIIAVLTIALFIRLVIIATNMIAAIENIQRLILINQEEINIGAGRYQHLPNGAGFLSPTHQYANDLDIFGHASVYQYINRTQSEQGNTILADWLLFPSNIETIHARQEAAKELAQQYKWRQQLQAHGMEQPLTKSTQAKVANWINQPNTFSASTGWKILRWGYPVVTISLVVLYVFDILPTAGFSAAYVIALALSALLKKIIFPQYSSLDKIVPEIDGLYNSAHCIESIAFTSPRLLHLQRYFLHNNSRSSVAIKQLKNILDKFDAGLNLLLLMILNPLLLWDLQLVFSLEKWRTDNKLKTLHWFTALGELEAINSIANLHFNHPHWTFPSFDAKDGTFKAMQLGHPLIPAHKMVYNDFSTEGTPQIALITGSNMAGKSTFLRSTGVNIVLAMIGAPVCAMQMTLSPMRVVSSMRIADNLEESTSTFYAELKKLKSIIDCVNDQQKVFVLLDEILRGTNSLDRHTGSAALIKQLVHKNAVAMLATHDVELAKLQDNFPQAIHNYHFDAQIAGEELYFDYKLKEGICQSINASILMKKIGIEL